jgi:purine-binding chemotaxis protein CheW
MSQEQTTEKGIAEATTGMYLMFALGNSQYGVEILKVRQIIPLIDAKLMDTDLPNAAQALRGVIELRGEIIPVYDMRLKVGMVSSDDHGKKCIIVVDVDFGKKNQRTGILVDYVLEVLRLESNALAGSTAFQQGNVEADMIKGVASINGQAKILLNIDRLLTTATDSRSVAAATGKAPTTEDATTAPLGDTLSKYID